MHAGGITLLRTKTRGSCGVPKSCMHDHSSKMNVSGSNTRVVLVKACCCRADCTRAATLGSSRQTIIL
eukprot:10577451-Heterocapsa_arctica.AAC.2